MSKSSEISVKINAIVYENGLSNLDLEVTYNKGDGLEVFSALVATTIGEIIKTDVVGALSFLDDYGRVIEIFSRPERFLLSQPT